MAVWHGRISSNQPVSLHSSLKHCAPGQSLLFIPGAALGGQPPTPLLEVWWSMTSCHHQPLPLPPTSLPTVAEEEACTDLACPVGIWAGGVAASEGERGTVGQM